MCRQEGTSSCSFYPHTDRPRCPPDSQEETPCVFTASFFTCLLTPTSSEVASGLCSLDGLSVLCTDFSAFRGETLSVLNTQQLKSSRGGWRWGAPLAAVSPPNPTCAGCWDSELRPSSSPWLCLDRQGYVDTQVRAFTHRLGKTKVLGKSLKLPGSYSRSDPQSLSQLLRLSPPSRAAAPHRHTEVSL